LRIAPFASSPKQGGKRWGERFLEENITFLREKSIAPLLSSPHKWGRNKVGVIVKVR